MTTRNADEIVDRGIRAIRSGEIKPSWKCLAQYLNMPNTTVRDIFARRGYKTYLSLSPSNKAPHPEMTHSVPQSFTEYREDGSVKVSKLLALHNEDDKKPRRIVELCGFAPDEWDIKNIRINDWNGMRKNDLGQVINHQVRIDLVPKRNDRLTLEAIDSFFSSYKNKSAPKKSTRKRNKKNEKRILEMCIADMHIGNSMCDVKKHVIDIVNRTLEEASNIDKIVVSTLGDTLHFDTMKRTTTDGTQLNATMPPDKMFDVGADVLITMLDMLASVAPVEFVGIYGNHDRLISYGLFRGLEWYYKDRDDIVIDSVFSITKARMLAGNLVVFAHGDMPRKNLKTIPYTLYKNMFGMATHTEIHAGHMHHRVTEENGSVITRFLPTITKNDEWHNKMGYNGAIRSSMSFIWTEKGLSNIIFSNL